MEDTNDVNGVDTSADSSTENKPESENVTEDAKMTDKRVMIPKDRFDEVNEANKKLKAELASVKASPKQTSQAGSDVEARLAAVEFMARHKEFDSRHFAAVDAIAKGKGITLEDAVKDELFIPYKDKLDSENAVQQATPQSGRSPKVAPPKPLPEMTRTEHEDYFRKRTGK